MKFLLLLPIIILLVDIVVATYYLLNNGLPISMIGLGTFEMQPEITEKVVKKAIDIGYRHIDTSFSYGNENEIGRAINAKIAEGVITRRDIFVTTKLPSAFHEPEYVDKAFWRSFKNLNISYIDMYMIEYPIAYGRLHKNGTDGNNQLYDVDDISLDALHQNGSRAYQNIDYLITYSQIEKFVRLGVVRSIGLSNFNIEQIERILANVRIRPAVNQIEFHPNLNQRKLREYCQRRKIVIVAHSPLGRPHTTNDTNMAFYHPSTEAIAKSYSASPAQILLRYALQLGTIVVVKSTKNQHLIDNFDLFKFHISQDIMKILHRMNTNTRLIDFPLDIHHNDYPFKYDPELEPKFSATHSPMETPVETPMNNPMDNPMDTPIETPMNNPMEQHGPNLESSTTVTHDHSEVSPEEHGTDFAVVSSNKIILTIVSLLFVILM